MFHFVFLERRSGWMRSKKQKRLTKKLLWLEVHRDTVSRGKMRFWRRTMPEVQRLHTETLPPVVWFLLHPWKQDLYALVNEQNWGKGAWIHCRSPLMPNIQWGPILWVAILHYMFCSVLCGCLSGKESECPRRQFTRYSLCDQRHEMLDPFEETLLSQSLQPTLERRF